MDRLVGPPQSRLLTGLTRLAAAIVLLLILWGALAPADPMPRYLPKQDKLEHLAAFMLLAMVLSAAASRAAMTFILLFCVTLAVGLEFAQALFTLHREPSVTDAAASITGALAGVTFVWILRSVGTRIAHQTILPAASHSSTRP